ncbi:DUF6545 domain-containing protein [Actinomycetes bacterium KLBMP 9797]
MTGAGLPPCAILLIAAAAVILGVGGAIIRSRRAVAAARMYPLSATMSKGSPSDGQIPKALAEVIKTSLGAKDDQLLNAMVMQIRDGYLQLRPYLDSRVSSLAMNHARAAGLSGQDLAAIVEAATLAVAMRTKRAGQPPADSTTRVDPGAPDLAGEARWLGRVSRAYARSPIVKQVLEETSKMSWVDEQLTVLGINPGGEAR